MSTIGFIVRYRVVSNPKRIEVRIFVENRAPRGSQQKFRFYQRAKRCSFGFEPWRLRVSNRQPDPYDGLALGNAFNRELAAI
jgi:hypothetical protein